MNREQLILLELSQYDTLFKLLTECPMKACYCKYNLKRTERKLTGCLFCFFVKKANQLNSDQKARESQPSV